MTRSELVKSRAAAFDAFKALADKPTLSAEERADYDVKMRAVTDLDDQIKRFDEARSLDLDGAKPVAGQDAVPAAAETSPYLNDAAARSFSNARGGREGSAKTLVLGGAMRMLAMGHGSFSDTRALAREIYGESHPVTRALMTSVGASGGFLVAPDQMAGIIEMLRAQSVVRAAGPRALPMPRGTMELPGQKTSATASYGAEAAKTKASQQTVDKRVASYKKLTAMVPVSNDMMRYADPAADAFVRDDLVQVMGLTEDRHFLLSDGSANTPRGFLSFANGWVSAHSGTPGVWSQSAKSILAVNGDDVTGDNATTGGNFITSTAVYTLDTVCDELGQAENKLDSANVPNAKRAWFMHPRSKNYLYNVQNSLGLYVFRDEMNKGTLNGHPFFATTQIGTGYYDAAASDKDCSFVLLTEMTEAMILDSMGLEMTVSTEGTYVDTDGVLQSAFQQDLTLIRAVAEHDFQMRHDQSVAVIQGVRWGAGDSATASS